MTKDKIANVLSHLVGRAENVLSRRSAQDRMPDLVGMARSIDEIMALPVEGGNPAGPESAMLVQSLIHVETKRLDGDDARASKWAMIAGALLPMVKDNLAAALVPAKFSTSEGAGGGRAR